MKARWILPVICVGLSALIAFPVAQADSDDDDDAFDNRSMRGDFAFSIDGSHQNRQGGRK